MNNDKPLYGSLKITNSRTLDMWKKTGKYQVLIDEGYFYSSGCGRFRIQICNCSKCKNNIINNLNIL